MTDARLDPNHSDHAACDKGAPKLLRVASPIAPMFKTPHKQAMRLSELLYGENAVAHGTKDDFYLIESRHDNYIGYSPKSHFCTKEAFAPTSDAGDKSEEANWQVQIAAAPIFAAADIKSPILAQLSGGSALSLKAHDNNGDYASLTVHLHGKAHKGYIHRAHIAEARILPLNADSLIGEARRYLGLPYIWGGRSFRGLDCSGLIQQVLAAFGLPCPRDSDMQAGLVKAITPIGAAIERHGTPQKGDICFWHGTSGGHVGIFTGSHLIHAYGGSCSVNEDAAKNIFPRLKSATNDDMRIVRCLI